MYLRLITAASALPVSAEDAATHLRQDNAGELPVIAASLAAACAMVEEITGRVLAAETWAVSVPRIDGDFTLPKSPVTSVTTISYFDVNDASQSATVADFYLFKGDQAVLRPKAGKSWPAPSNGRDDAITVTFIVGYTTLPPALRAAILMITGHLYWNRSAVAADQAVAVLPIGVAALTEPYRLGWVAA